MTSIRFVSGEELADLAEPSAYVDAVREGYRDRGDGAPARPRTTLESPAEPGVLTGYLAILPTVGYMGGYTYAAGFARRDAWFTLQLFDAHTGEILALIDGAVMNPFKTGAAGAVGIDALAREDAATLGVIGSGSQARGQLLAAAIVRELEEVLVYSSTREHRESFATEFDERLDASVRAVSSVEELVPAVDILITATDSKEPLFDGSLLTPGTHVTAMGQYHPDRREIDAETVSRSTYVPDLRERAFQDAGAFLQALEEGRIQEGHIHAELGDIVAGHAPGRTNDDEITLFDSGGTAIETVAAAGMLYERADAAGLGTTLDLLPASESFIGR